MERFTEIDAATRAKENAEADGFIARVIRDKEGKYTIAKTVDPDILRKAYFVGKAFSPKRVADVLLPNYQFVKHPIVERDYLLVYDPAKEKYENATTFLRNRTTEMLCDLFKPEQYPQVADYIKGVTNYAQEPNADLIPLQNGVYNWKAKTFTPHTPELFFDTKLAVKYDPTADCPRFKEFLNDVTDEKTQKTIRQIFAYTLVKTNELQRAFMLYGPAGCGKSQLLNVLLQFVGNDNAVNIPLQDLESRPYSRASLFSKYLNVCADIPNTGIAQATTFKAITGGDPIHAENKYEKPFNFTAYCKLVFSANEMPRTYENPEAWASRWVFIPFSKRFRDQDNEIRDIWRLCSTPIELSGIFNWVIGELDPLFANGKFETDQNLADKVEFYRLKTDPAYDFILKWFEPKPDAMLLNSQIASAFEKYCEEARIAQKDERQFMKEFRSAAEREYGLDVSFHKSNAARYVQGIDFTDAVKEKLARKTPKNYLNTQ